MARKKPKNSPVFESWDEVGSALKEICDAEREVTIIEKAAEETITIAKEVAKVDAAPYLTKIKYLEAAVEQFANHHKDDFDGEKRSRSFGFGKIGYRKSPGKLALLNRKWSWERIAELFRTQKLRTCFRVKIEVNKDAIGEAIRAGKIDDEWLREHGLKWAEPDEFYIEAQVNQEVNE